MPEVTLEGLTCLTGEQNKSKYPNLILMMMIMII
jgi:hypothetical protein